MVANNAPTAFTDDDLKHLKEYLGPEQGPNSFWTLKLPQLLARLEAAEACAYSCNAHSQEAEKLYGKWYRAAGK